MFYQSTINVVVLYTANFIFVARTCVETELFLQTNRAILALSSSAISTEFSAGLIAFRDRSRARVRCELIQYLP
jgi:hypothetical protein